MHLLTEKTVEIQCSAGALFAFAANMENFSRWFPGVLAIRAEDNAPHDRVGKAYLEQVRLPAGRTRTIPIRVVEIQKPNRFVTEGQFAPLHPRMTVIIEPLSACSSRLTWSMHSRSDNMLFRYTLLPLFRRVMEQRAAVGVRKLKGLMEATRAVSMESYPC